MSANQHLSTSLSKNKQLFSSLLPLQASFDFVVRDLSLGSVPCFFFALSGLCDLDEILSIFSEIDGPDFQPEESRKNLDLPRFIRDQFLYAQVDFSSAVAQLTRAVLSGNGILLIDGYSQGLIIDARSYPTRSTEEPETEKVLQGAKDGFVENLLTNCSLLRRRLRSPALTCRLHSVGTVSQTDVAVAYLQGSCDSSLLASLEETLDHLEVSALTMGIQSLKELLIKKSFLHPMPSVFLTQRPDVACSYLTEGYILLLVDNSPLALVLPCTLFQFTQSPVDYYKSPIVGTYLRLIRFLCLLISLFLMPVFLLLALNPGWLPPALQTLVPADVSGTAVFIYVLFVELGLDLFKYASSHTSNGFSGTFGIVGGLLIGDMAIKLSWASTEVIFYGAATLLASLGLPGIELRDAIKIYRLFLILCTGFFSWPGFWVGLFLVFLSLITTPVYGNKSYFWPLFPFRWDALKTLLFRYPTFKAQPENQKSPE